MLNSTASAVNAALHKETDSKDFPIRMRIFSQEIPQIPSAQ
jgi:hypothetical protein